MDRRDFLKAGTLLAATGMAALRGERLALARLCDCQKVTKDGVVPPSPYFWDAARRRLSLDGGRNEVVAAQLMLTAPGGDVENVDVEIGDLP
jgi:hypothetical protein